MVRPEVQGDWMEAALERGLGRVAAPPELWDRVRSPRVERPRVHMSVNAARMSACATLAIVIIVLLWGMRLRTDELRSTSPSEIRNWVQAKTGMDVPLHAGNLVGARVKPGGAEIACRVGGHNISLLVSNDRDRRSPYSWVAGGQSYMLACSEPADLAACMLCHAGG
jgi:hypothetical protein